METETHNVEVRIEIVNAFIYYIVSATYFRFQNTVLSAVRNII